jgi:hypothetical protein
MADQLGIKGRRSIKTSKRTFTINIPSLAHEDINTILIGMIFRELGPIGSCWITGSPESELPDGGKEPDKSITLFPAEIAKTMMERQLSLDGIEVVGSDDSDKLDEELKRWLTETGLQTD